MIHTLLGEENYRKATDLYFESFDGQAVTTNDFLWAMSKASGVDLSAFELWYHQSGTPKLHVNEAFSDGVYTVTLTQKVPNAVDGSPQKPYFFPLKIGLLNASGEEIEAKTLIISQESEVFRFEGFAQKPILSINRDFSAPIFIEHKESNLAFLMKYDTNAFVQYESAQNFGIMTIESLMQGEALQDAFVEAYGALLDLDVDLSYKALLLELPSVSTLMQRMNEIDFDAIYAAKERLLAHLAEHFEQKLLALYTKHHEPKSLSIDALAMGKRSLKNRVLKLLCETQKEQYILLAKSQYENSLTMTDRVAALDILENTNAALSTLAMSDFYEKYKTQTLVMNKYFSILAASHREGVLDRVMALQNDPVYDEKVPNLVRSLIGVFARNYKYFHAKDGYGYRFVEDKILEIDTINAQMASGLCGAFKIYDKMNSHNKALMRESLERIKQTQGLSKNSFEIVSKILKEE
jgi:aminopeptidase N